MPEQFIKISRALLSVSDKTGLLPLAARLAGAGVEILSTGGTAAMLREGGVPVRDVADVTAFPEMLGGRIKTLHPAVHGGLLALRDDPDHRAALAEHGIGEIDLLVVNLYPFEATAASGADYATCVENIDIGGPAMLRAAAKNHAFVTVLTDVADYAPFLAEFERTGGGTGIGFRRACALTAYGRTAAYDARVTSWLAEAIGEATPRRRVFSGRLAQGLRYGENPHQRAAFYVDGSQSGIAGAHQHQGKELSYNNINDADAAWELAAAFPADEGPACVIVKHANPCGVACEGTLEAAYRAAYDCDRVSAFGGVVAFNSELDAAAAAAVAEIFTEVVIAPSVSSDAAAMLATRKNLRLLTAGAAPDPAAPGLAWRQVAGGFLVQERDAGRIDAATLQVVTKRAPTEAELADLLFAWRVAKHVKSNAIVYARGGATVGIGAGQMSRVDSARIAARKAADMAEALGLAEPPTIGSVVASDAFFPFPDGVLTLAEAGATAVIQPGGSLRDAEVIAAADAAGIAMVFTGMRHFRH
ncbi:bifunctional phosphoribosylaminoimidazolecarboxamide formyltransferase/IMP cyclohydrolase [Amaricoccus sp.]|uniref:bifunctional phosphoribosylaminoimidazolecarboxamide formyltransferase/IMP cyclohydrolase n=1 Tax=Amaricoccus sp. TaxID=1872485 RepID=UPI001B4F86C1|nr:bifunctional phosphoribosylaminoimidazolecarboxamide formyltransferase/IMP cyclohydrolase [Amaricoccus sp.]MBP7242634.1 bifunctional phosphoribosylaminoimidazolecarboxamide formyltransferase/IMP cyclohydrolase [Amaricoccus sp.]